MITVLCVCVYTCMRECECVCGPGKPYLMGTISPHKDGSSWGPKPFFGPHEENSL